VREAGRGQGGDGIERSEVGLGDLVKAVGAV